MIDAGDEGFHLTSKQNGVRFKFFPEQIPVLMSWTDPFFGNGFLVLDRNKNGVIDDGTEMFGNLTEQPPSATPNGYSALSIYDKPESGGNGNGYIDAADAIFPELRVWVDKNHNGISEATELRMLDELGIEKIGTTYTQSKYVDVYGNEFRYRARVWFKNKTPRENSYDVFLQ